MTNRERFVKALRFEKGDRLPVIEFAAWWSETLDRWNKEGLPAGMTSLDLFDYFGLDKHVNFRTQARGPECPRAPGHGMPIIHNAADYYGIKRHLFPGNAVNRELSRDLNELQTLVKMHEDGDVVIWWMVDGYFWFPRTLFGIENHLTAFYDHPDLMKEMNESLLEWQLHTLERFCAVLTPDFVTFTEDLAYNHGPMLSKQHFDEFVGQYYRQIIPEVKKRGIIPFIDTDGDATIPAEWFLEVGVEGTTPLERRAGTDVNQLRRDHPNLKMIGAFDKTVMHLGENRMREEFERLLPVMKQGGYIPSCDHQTPPAVSLEDYRLYVRLLKEYCEEAVT